MQTPQTDQPSSTQHFLVMSRSCSVAISNKWQVHAYQTQTDILENWPAKTKQSKVSLLSQILPVLFTWSWCLWKLIFAQLHPASFRTMTHEGTLFCCFACDNKKRHLWSEGLQAVLHPTALLKQDNQFILPYTCSYSHGSGLCLCD